MARSRPTPPSAAGLASTRSFEEHGADAYAGFLRDLREALQDPPDFVLWDMNPPVPRTGRDSVIGDCVVIWFD